MKKPITMVKKLIIGLVLFLIVAVFAGIIYMIIPVKKNNVPTAVSQAILKDLGINNTRDVQITKYVYRRWNDLTVKIECSGDYSAFLREFFEAHDYLDGKIDKSKVDEDLEKMIKSLKNSKSGSAKYRNIDGEFVSGYHLLCPDDASLLIYIIDGKCLIEANYFPSGRKIPGS